MQTPRGQELESPGDSLSTIDSSVVLSDVKLGFPQNYNLMLKNVFTSMLFAGDCPEHPPTPGFE